MTGPPPASEPSGRGVGAPAATPAGFIGRYQILEKIGEGGMGSLFLARDPAIDRLVALKLLRRGFDTVALRERFAREARAAGRLRHPNIVTIFDVGEHHGDPFIAMEFLAGETLDELIRHGARLSLVRRLTLIEELCDGLAYAHRAGIVHRDIKPANLMVDSDGVLKILDFGIVRLDEGSVTQSGMLVGTVNYMSPEQVNGSGVDHRSDIFAVGLVAYELLTSRQAFPGTLKDGLFNRILNVACEPLSKVLPELDLEVSRIVELAIRADPAERYQDLARMRNDFQRARRRLEAAEDRAMEELGGGTGETMMVSAPVPTPPLGTRPKSSAALDAAEKALSSGDFRAAMVLAGRSAATEPGNDSASAILARAQAGLLERGRTLGSQGSGGTAPSGAPAVTPSGAPLPTPSGMAAAPHFSAAMIVAAAMLAVAIVTAAILVTRKSAPPDAVPQSSGQEARQSSVPDSAQAPAPGSAGAPAPAPRGAGPPSSAAEPAPREAVPPRLPSDAATSTRRGDGLAGRQGSGASSRVSSEPPMRSEAPARSTAPEAGAAPTVLRAGRDVSAPRRMTYVEPLYPVSGPRLQGTVRVEVIIGQDGRVTDAKVTAPLAPAFDQAALAAVRRWEFAPTRLDGQPVAVVHSVDVEFTPPAPTAVASGPPAPAMQLPATREEPPPAAPKPAAPAASQPPRDETAAIRAVLRQYEAAWEAKDADAIARVHQLAAADAAVVRKSLADAEQYSMEVTVLSIEVDSGGRTATVRCAIDRSMKPRNGRTARATGNHTITLEKRGDSWIITAIR